MSTPVRILLAVLAFGASAALAQVLYKSTMPDGKVVYGDKPAPGAAKVEETRPDTSKKGIGASPAAQAKEAEVLKQLQQDRAKREAASDSVQAAEKTLRAAEAARDGGKEPLPNERIGTAGGKSRLNDAYFERQKRLEKDVEDARRKLEAARAGK